MNIRDYVNPLIKWWWLILIATLVAGASSYYVTRPLPPIYQARTTLVAGTAFFQLNPSGTDFGLGQDLAQTYVNIATLDQVKEATKKALGLQDLPSYQATVTPNSQMIVISVTDTNPQRAAAVANELANQLMLQTPTSTEAQNQARTAFINQQLDTMQNQINDLNNQISQKTKDLQGMTSALQISQAQQDLTALQTKLQIAQTNYATLLNNSQHGAANSLTVIEKAGVPVTPIGPNKPVIILLVAAIGFILASVIAHLLEYIDKTVKNPEDISRILGLPVIGYIGDMGKKGHEFMYVTEHPHTPISEAFRSLRTNIEFASVEKSLKTIMITSPGTEDGKTTLAVNLALMMAQDDRRVMLVDGDLRRPNLHELFKLPVQPGLTDSFREHGDIFDVFRTWKDKSVTVITAGNQPPNPTELLGSKKMSQVLEKLREAMDVAIIDGPPMIVTDAAVLSSKVDGVVVVIRPGETRADVVKAEIDQLRKVGANIIGVVLNRIRNKSIEAYGGNYAYSPHYKDGAYFTTGKPKSRDMVNP